MTEAQFDEMFPARNSLCTYSGLVAATSAYPGFASTGTDEVRKREAAALLANVHHDTGGLEHIVESGQADHPNYCDASRPYGCPAGQTAYHGRGPIQLSWNFNYNAAGEALGLPLLTEPWQVQNDAATAWKTGLWNWNTQTGLATTTPHDAVSAARASARRSGASTETWNAAAATRQKSRAAWTTAPGSPQSWVFRQAAPSAVDSGARTARAPEVAPIEGVGATSA
ncbi:hypothetical protein H4W33_004444 [Kibdelosporangium phytohabitans]|nr:hypothetical protein [Kibdelosporangium phytohabitans]